MKIVAEAPKPLKLPLVHHYVTFRIVPNQNLHEGRVKLINMHRIILAILKVKLVLTRLLHGHCKGQATFLSLSKNFGAEFFIHEQTSDFSGNTLFQSFLEACKNHFLVTCNLFFLFNGWLTTLDAEHFLRE